MYEVLIQKQYDYSLLRFPELESSKIIPKPIPDDVYFLRNTYLLHIILVKKMFSILL